MKYIKLFEGFKKTDPYIYDNPEFVELIENVIESNASFICTFVASAIRMLEGNNVQVYGFATCDNPEATYFLEENGEDSDEGHHFAVLDNRYIIDPWVYNNFYNDGTFNRSVFDLNNIDDKDIIKYLYGNRVKWVNITNGIDKHDDFKKRFPKSYQKLIDYHIDLNK